MTSNAISLFSKFGYDCRSCVYCKVLFHYTVPVWKSTLLVVGIWNKIIYWGPHLSLQPTCMLFLLYHLWYYLNYRDINNYLTRAGGGGGVTGPPGPPPGYAPDEEKKILPSLVYVLIKTWNLAFSCPGRAAMAKKCTKKRDARAELWLYLFISTYCLFAVFFVVAVVAS